jgi:hypothetical protein
LPNKNESVPSPIEPFVVSKKCFVQKDRTWEQIDEGYCQGWLLETDTYPDYGISKVASGTVDRKELERLGPCQLAYRPNKITRV